MQTYVEPVRQGTILRYLRETALLVWRSLLGLKAVPQRLSDVTIQPVIFTVLFVYVFGAAINIPGIRYQDFLLPGLIAQTISFAMMGPGMATANDIKEGVTDRFKSMPIMRASIITAQVVSQVVEQLLGMTLTVIVGLLVGWRPNFSFAEGLLLVGLIVLALTAFVLLGVLLGLLLNDADAVMGIGFAIVFPLAFLGGTYVPIESMAKIPRLIGEYNPVSAIVAAFRELCAGYSATGSWPLENPILATIIWCVAIIVVCMPLAIKRFNTVTAD